MITSGHFWILKLGRAFGWFSFLGALIYSFGLFISNLNAFPLNVGVSEWWGSELAIRYCAGFVRRGILGQLAWWFTGLINSQSYYVVALSAIMAASSVALGFILLNLLRKRLSLLPALLILFAPTAYPVMLTHAGSLFRKDALQLCLFYVILCLVGKYDQSASSSKKLLLYSLVALLQIFAVLNHEPFALLILPALFLVRILSHQGYRDALLFSLPGVLTFFIAAVYKGRPKDVSCLQTSLQSIGLLPPGAVPGSSITELALMKPSFFTWDLSPNQLAWSLLHGVLAICIACLCYVLIAQQIKRHQLPWLQAGKFLFIQLLIAMPLFMATIDYGRWFSMLSCSGMQALLSMPSIEGVKGDNIQQPKSLPINALDRVPIALLSLACVFIVPSHCCTYRLSQVFDFIPYSALGIWKQILI